MAWFGSVSTVPASALVERVEESGDVGCGNTSQVHLLIREGSPHCECHSTGASAVSLSDPRPLDS